MFNTNSLPHVQQMDFATGNNPFPDIIPAAQHNRVADCPRVSRMTEEGHHNVLTALMTQDRHHGAG